MIRDVCLNICEFSFESIPHGWLSDKSTDNRNAFVNVTKRENNQEAADKTVKALPEVTALRVTNNIRKTSISMPSKLNEMDDLRTDRQNVSKLIYVF